MTTEYEPRTGHEAAYRHGRLVMDSKQNLVDELDRLSAELVQCEKDHKELSGAYENACVERERLRAELSEWRSAARYDPKGPQFKGWDRSQLDRCRRTYIERPMIDAILAKTQPKDTARER